VLQNSERHSLNGSYYWLVWSKQKYTAEIGALNLGIDTEMIWAHPGTGINEITLHDLYKINYSWQINGTAAGHWNPDKGLIYTLTQPKYLRRQDMRGIVFTAGLAVRSQKHTTATFILKYEFLNFPSKQTPWPLVRERTIPTDRPPLVDEI
jgi:hypothetical protein